jgi:hypothetical protein
MAGNRFHYTQTTYTADFTQLEEIQRKKQFNTYPKTNNCKSSLVRTEYVVDRKLH